MYTIEKKLFFLLLSAPSGEAKHTADVDDDNNDRGMSIHNFLDSHTNLYHCNISLSLCVCVCLFQSLFNNCVYRLVVGIDAPPGAARPKT